MKADYTEAEEAAISSAEADTVEESGAVNDPFASDLFAAAIRVTDDAGVDDSSAPQGASQLLGEDERNASTIITPGVPWQTLLPRVTSEQMRVSASLNLLPASFSTETIETLRRVLARYANVAIEETAIEPVDVREAALHSIALRSDTAPRIFASFTIEPDGAHLAAEFDAGFAAALIDRVLGGDGASHAALRPLSTAEKAVLEFLCLSATRELEQTYNAPFLRLDSVGSDPPAWLTAQPSPTTAAPPDTPDAFRNEAENDSARRGLAAVVNVNVSAAAGFARLYASADALAALSAALQSRSATSEQTPNAGDDANSAGDDDKVSSTQFNRAREKANRLARFMPDVCAALLIGETEVAALDLAQLETDDVLIVERSYVRWRDGRIGGDSNVRVRVGTWQGVQLEGRFEKRTERYDGDDGLDKADDEASATIKFVVEAITVVDEPLATERLDMQEEEELMDDEAALAEAGNALDGLVLTVHVELGARRVRLEDLAQLRAGQLIDLGCKATDAVDLVADGRRIARGELIDIEGRLGVRITRVAS